MTSSAVKNRRRHGIDRTRGQFDDILEELTHRIDVPARVRDKVHDVEETVQVKAEEVEQQVPEIAETLDVAETLEVAETLDVAADEAAWQIEELAGELPEEVLPQMAAHVAPEPVTARQRPPIVAIAVAVLLVLLVLRRLLRRSS
jgi:hypothetical protein